MVAVMLVRALCWLLVFLARALEWTRRGWEELCMRALGRRFYERTERLPSGFTFRILSRAGRVAIAPVRWIHGAAVWLIVAANRGLPPIPEDRGFLARLYP